MSDTGRIPRLKLWAAGEAVLRTESVSLRDDQRGGQGRPSYDKMRRMRFGDQDIVGAGSVRKGFDDVRPLRVVPQRVSHILGDG